MFAKGAGVFLVPPAVASAALFTAWALARLWPLFTAGAILAALALFLAVFFRDPERAIGDGIVAPADGVVQGIREAGVYDRIEIFMNVHNVHVNRAPLDGTVVSVEHFPGKLRAAFDKDAEHNERIVTVFKTDIGEVKVVQIAGMVARRAVTYLKKGESVTRGQRIGMIRLGSRVDLYIPRGSAKITAALRQKTAAGQTTVAVKNV